MIELVIHTSASIPTILTYVIIKAVQGNSFIPVNVIILIVITILVIKEILVIICTLVTVLILAILVIRGMGEGVV